MKIVLIQNRSSGTGNRQSKAAAVADALTTAGHAVQTLDAGPQLTTDVLGTALSGMDACVIGGGDGTVHYALPALARSGVPLYHFPLGTENLFARHFGMDREIQRLVRSLGEPRVEEVDLATCDGRTFSLMCSVGFDAAVVERVAANRSGGVRRMDYALHMLAELARPRTPVLSIVVDGKRIVDARHGMVVIANSRQYAARLDPARHASMTDGLLDVVFLPHATRTGLVRWMLAVRSGSHLKSAHVVTAQGRELEITIDGRAPHQLDGESVALGDAAAQRSMRIAVVPRALRVLLPV